ncbi:hypothetical protein Tco_0833236 [Tanacetum coccineum]
MDALITPGQTYLCMISQSFEGDASSAVKLHNGVKFNGGWMSNGEVNMIEAECRLLANVVYEPMYILFTVSVCLDTI